MPVQETQPLIPGWLLEEAVEPNATLRQGDLIKFQDPSLETERAGLIVTADCDLEQRKHAQLVTMVPLVSTTVVLENYLLLEDCERKRALIEGYIFKAYGFGRSQGRDVCLTMLRKTVGQAVDHVSAEGVAAAFALGSLHTISIGSYKALMDAIKTPPRKPEALRDQLRTRGDLLILPSAEKLGVRGEIAWVRHIWQSPLSDIAMRTSEVNERKGERIARLDSPYRYRLTQLMAQVFSDIGLPSIPDRIEESMKDNYANA